MTDRLIDLIKWFVGSVVLVVVTLIIDTGFRKREAEIQEMQVYDKYVDIILSADNIEQRWKLSQYFSIVSPSERFRERWSAYKDTIQSDYLLWKKSTDFDSSSITNNTPLISHGASTAAQYESEAFSALFQKDIQSAILNFERAESLYPTYHNCWEISKWLKQTEIKSEQDWKKLYQKIYRDWSWGLNASIKSKLKELSN